MSETIKSLMDDIHARESYWIEQAMQNFTSQLCCLMKERGVTKAELARRLGKSPAYVTKILRGNTNFTINSMVQLARAVEGDVFIQVGRVDGARVNMVPLHLGQGGMWPVVWKCNSCPQAAQCNVPIPVISPA